MRVSVIHDHNGAEAILSEGGGTKRELLNVFTDGHMVLGRTSTYDIKSLIGEKMGDLGWADSVKLKSTNLTVSFMKNKIGVCFQLGNVARSYADLLKLQFLFQEGVIRAGVIAVPTKNASCLMGSNHANFERLSSELSLFREIITLPLLLIGLEK